MPEDKDMEQKTAVPSTSAVSPAVNSPDRPSSSRSYTGIAESNSDLENSSEDLPNGKVDLPLILQMEKMGTKIIHHHDCLILVTREPRDVETLLSLKNNKALVTHLHPDIPLDKDKNIILANLNAPIKHYLSTPAPRKLPKSSVNEYYVYRVPQSPESEFRILVRPVENEAPEMTQQRRYLERAKFLTMGDGTFQYGFLHTNIVNVEYSATNTSMTELEKLVGDTSMEEIVERVQFRGKPSDATLRSALGKRKLTTTSQDPEVDVKKSKASEVYGCVLTSINNICKTPNTGENFADPEWSTQKKRDIEEEMRMLVEIIPELNSEEKTEIRVSNMRDVLCKRGKLPEMSVRNVMMTDTKKLS